MAPLIITAAPYGSSWLPGDTTDIAVTWDEQVQAGWIATTPVAAWAGTYTDAGPAFYLEHLKRLRNSGIHSFSRWRTCTN
jgi:hypothetical protein